MMLLARLWDPETGQISLDGRDLRSFARSELSGEIAYVPQHAFLFDDTVAGNITLGEDLPEGRSRGGGPGGGRRTSSSPSCPRATTRESVSGARPSPVDNNSASPWPGPW